MSESKRRQHAIRKFETGAMRDVDVGKLDYEGFLSPAALERYAEYMHRHRQQRDGTLRASDNWQLGIPKEQYMKSLWRHFMEVWKIHRRSATRERSSSAPVGLEDALCGVLFNAMGYLHEAVKGRLADVGAQAAQGGPR